jgi:transcription elongation factor Elf1
MRYEAHFEKIDIPADMIILRCPFCGSKNITAFRDSLFDGESNIGFYCGGCETLVETKFNNIKSAIDYCWNNRSD